MGIYIHKASDHSFSRVDGAAGPAKSISFDPTISDLDADNVQDAVDEVAGALDDKQDKLTNPLTQADVVNNLTSTATNLPLSAAMGKSLSDGWTVDSFDFAVPKTGVKLLTNDGSNPDSVRFILYKNGVKQIRGLCIVTFNSVVNGEIIQTPNSKYNSRNDGSQQNWGFMISNLSGESSLFRMPSNVVIDWNANYHPSGATEIVYCFNHWYL